MESKHHDAGVDVLLAALRHSTSSGRTQSVAAGFRDETEDQAHEKPFIIFVGEMSTTSLTNRNPISKGNIFEGLSRCKNMQDMFLALKHTMADIISHNDSVLVEKKILYWVDERFNNEKTWYYAYGPPISTKTGGLERAFEHSIQEVRHDPFYDPESYFRITIRSYGHDSQESDAEAIPATEQEQDTTGAPDVPRGGSKEHEPAQRTDDIETNSLGKLNIIKRDTDSATETKPDPTTKRNSPRDIRITTRRAEIGRLKQAMTKEVKVRRKIRNMRRRIETVRVGKRLQTNWKFTAKLSKGRL